MLEQDFPRDFGSLEPIFGFVRSFLAARGIDDRHAWDLDLIVEELFTNMVKYAPGRHPIRVGLDWERPVLTVQLRDFGVPAFDPTRAPKPDVEAPVSERRAGGLGIHLVRSIADALEYQHRDGDSVVTVRKRLDP